jgi:outer membrane protein
MPAASALIKCWPVGGNAKKFAIAWGLSACLAMLLLAERAGAAMAADQAPFSPGTELTLKRAIEISLRYHPRRREAQADVDAARQRVGEARAYLMPQVSGDAQYLRATDNGIDGTNYFSVPLLTRVPSNGPRNNQTHDTTNNYTLAMTAYQHLLDFGRTRGFIDQRRFESAAQEAELRLVDLDLAFEVASRYFGLLSAAQIVKVYEEAIKQRQFQVDEAKVKAGAGLKPEMDVYMARAELAHARVSLVDANNGQANAKVALDNAMGLDGDAPDYKLADSLSYSPIKEPLESYLKSATAHRPDLIALENQARAAGAQVTEYRSDYFPTFGATVGYNVRSQGLPMVNNFDVGLVITWPIFNGFLTTHEVGEARMQQESIRHAIEDLEQRIYYQVKSEFLDWQASLQRIARAAEALDASRAELELGEKRYQVGLGSIIELTDAQRQFTQDDAEYINARYAFAVAKATVERDSACCMPDVQR